MPSTAQWAKPQAPIAATKTRRSLAQQVRDATADGADVVDVLVGILHDVDAPTRDRIHAGSILLDRGFGTSVQTSVVLTADANQSEALAALADAELERLARGGAADVTLPVSAVHDALPTPVPPTPAAVTRGALAAHGPLPDAPVEFLEGVIPPPGYPRDAPAPVLDVRPYVDGVPVGPAPVPAPLPPVPRPPPPRIRPGIATIPNGAVAGTPRRGDKGGKGTGLPFGNNARGGSWTAQARASRGRGPGPGTDGGEGG